MYVWNLRVVVNEFRQVSDSSHILSSQFNILIFMD